MKNDTMQTYLLVADAGSTKSAWCLICPDGKQHIMYTKGINPITQSDEQICAILTDDLSKQLDTYIPHIDAIRNAAEMGIL